MTELIIGMPVDVGGAELVAMLRDRLTYHKARVEAYQGQLAQMAEINKTLSEEARQMGKTSQASPMDSIEAAIKKHQNQVIYYDFCAKHIVQTATYRLSEQELIRIGVAPNPYG